MYGTTITLTCIALNGEEPYSIELIPPSGSTSLSRAVIVNNTDNIDYIFVALHGDTGTYTCNVTDNTDTDSDEAEVEVGE